MSSNTTNATNCSSTAGTNRSVFQYGQKTYQGKGHDVILESHDDSARNAFIYIGLILFVYLMAVVVIAVRYLVMRSNRDFSAFTTSAHHSHKRRGHSGFTPLTPPTVVVSPHIVKIENIETQRVLQETEL